MHFGDVAASFEGLDSVAWWQQLVRDEREPDLDVEYESCDEHGILEQTVGGGKSDSEAELASQKVMMAATVGKASYGDLVGRRELGRADSSWGSAASKTVVAGGRRGRAARRRGRQHQPQQTSSTGAASSSGAEAKPLEEPSANLLARNRFAALAVVEEAGEYAKELGSEESPCAEEASCEAGAAKELELLLTGWAASCPAFGGTARQAARQEIEAMISWLPSQLQQFPGAAWQDAIVRQLHSCEEAWLCLAISDP